MNTREKSNRRLRFRARCAIGIEDARGPHRVSRRKCPEKSTGVVYCNRLAGAVSARECPGQRFDDAAVTRRHRMLPSCKGVYMANTHPCIAAVNVMIYEALGQSGTLPHQGPWNGSRLRLLSVDICEEGATDG